MRLVGGRVGGADEPPEMVRPTQLLGLAAQDRAGLVADDREVEAGFVQPFEERGRARDGRKALHMHRQERRHVDLARLLPALAEKPRKAVAEAEAHALAA